MKLVIFSPLITSYMMMTNFFQVPTLLLHLRLFRFNVMATIILVVVVLVVIVVSVVGVSVVVDGAPPFAVKYATTRAILPLLAIADTMMVQPLLNRVYFLSLLISPSHKDFNISPPWVMLISLIPRMIWLMLLSLNTGFQTQEHLIMPLQTSTHFRNLRSTMVLTLFVLGMVQDLSTKTILLKGVSRDGLYQFSVPSPVAYLSARASPEIWHHRLGHPHVQVLRRALNHCPVSGSFDILNKHLCSACQLGKSSRFSLPRLSESSQHVLDLVYSDIWGPSPYLSNEGYRYFVIFVDDFSRYIWFYPMKQKSDLHVIFPQFHALVERLFSCKMKSFQSDLGGEYRKLRKTLLTLGINHRQSCAHTHAQNGRVERRHRHVVETGLTLLAHASVHPRFWSYAFETATYLINRMPTSTLHNDSPYSLLFQKQPNYSFLRSFGCLCFPYLRPYNQHKVNFRSSRCVFLGYPSSFSGYRCLDLNTGKIFIARIVRFDENCFPLSQASQLQATPPSTQTSSPWCICTLPGCSRVHQSSQPESSSPGPQHLLAPTAATRPPSSSNRHPPASRPHRTHHMVLRHMTRSIAPTANLTTTPTSEPTCFTQAVKSAVWRQAMDTEFNALLANQTWELIPPTPSMNIIGCKWVFRIKHKADGTIDRYKARLVAKGFNQIEGEDYSETFSPVVKPTTVRLILALAVTKGWNISQLDVHNAFLNGHLMETVYMRQPPGYVLSTAPNHVCRLRRSLYGLKQAPRAWYQRLLDYLLSIGFRASKTDVSLFIYTHDHDMVFLLVYVDDILVTGNNASLIATIIGKLSRTFKIRDLGRLSFFLGIEAISQDGGILLSQRKYLEDIIHRAGLDNCKPVATPFSVTDKLTAASGTPLPDARQYRMLAGALQYATITRPDLSFAVNKICQYMHAPTDVHWKTLKRILRYVKSTSHFGLRFTPSPSFDIHAFSDSDWAGCLDDRKSTSGYAVFVGSNLISWVSRKQKTVARSSTEAEYKAIADVTAEVIWVVSLLRELGLSLPHSPRLWCDNLGATYMCVNPIFHARTKHVEIDYHFVRDLVAKGAIHVRFLSTKDQLADVFTKPLSASRFAFLRDKLQVVPRELSA
ncbi:unnamed protein product [Cuscuta epithymum]|uniref:Integrase catalytic domain-containing protein n=1 Tax=Cuscuta epithymum TaxID=186058 RepID=A0AAV0GFX9_9ASTE|nr:unnamed protein product [Cuscuta epithymum]